ncbi:MAG: cupin domain-containing protein [Bacteroidales bacterium]|jgi:quercetin dioxygenase-like cupin family protein|nr:cupin domain-containing protein [Bacteroidales bacterium]HBG86879.1 cupin domain-containing protein [Marinilabiliaceae bacterium]HBX89262.1 cupin domain-containing protein [Marinilabiliaceae bacterium]
MTTLAESAKVFSPVERISYADNSVVSQQLTKNPSGNITLFSFDKGQQLSEHAAPFDATVHVVDGEASIVIGGQAHTVKAGEMIIMPANIPHAVYATTKFKMLLIMIKG